MAPRELDIREKPPLLCPDIEPAPLENPSVHVLVPQERPNPVGEPDLASSARRNLVQVMEDSRRERVTTDRHEIRGDAVAARFLFDAPYFVQPPTDIVPKDHSVRGDLIAWNLLDRDARRVQLRVDSGQRRGTRRAPKCEVVSEEDGERVPSNRGLRTEDGVSVAKRLVLPDIRDARSVE